MLVASHGAAACGPGWASCWRPPRPGRGRPASRREAYLPCGRRCARATRTSRSSTPRSRSCLGRAALRSEELLGEVGHAVPAQSPARRPAGGAGADPTTTSRSRAPGGVVRRRAAQGQGLRRLHDAERRRARRLVLPARSGARRGGRAACGHAPARRQPDHRATMRASLRYGGEPLQRRCASHAPPAAARARRRRVGLDGALRAHAATATSTRAWPPAAGSRPSPSDPPDRLTRELGRHDPDAAFERAARR